MLFRSMRDTTIQAVDAAVDLMADDGVVFITVYPGHGEGKLEGELIEEKYANLNRSIYCVTVLKIINSPDSPYFIIIQKNGRKN